MLSYCTFLSPFCFKYGVSDAAILANILREYVVEKLFDQFESDRVGIVVTSAVGNELFAVQ
jgi:hypothetical protein